VGTVNRKNKRVQGKGQGGQKEMWKGYK